MPPSIRYIVSMANATIHCKRVTYIVSMVNASSFIAKGWHICSFQWLMPPSIAKGWHFFNFFLSGNATTMHWNPRGHKLCMIRSLCALWTKAPIESFWHNSNHPETSPDTTRNVNNFSSTRKSVCVCVCVCGGRRSSSFALITKCYYYRLCYYYQAKLL